MREIKSIRAVFPFVLHPHLLFDFVFTVDLATGNIPIADSQSGEKLERLGGAQEVSTAINSLAGLVHNWSRDSASHDIYRVFLFSW